jgi:Tol biopolymer transport system component
MKKANSYKTTIVWCVVAGSILLVSGGTAWADFIFGEPTNLGPSVNSDKSERGLSISADGLSLFFDSDQPDGGDYDLYVATRETIDAPWEPAVNLGPIVNSPMTHNEAHPSISSDGLELYFSGQHWQPNATGYGQSDLWVTRRASLSDPWGVPQNLGSLVNTASNEAEPSISADGLSLYFMSERSAGQGQLDIWVTKRPTTNADWDVPVNLGAPVNSSGWECAPTISADGLILFFQSDRSGGEGQLDIWMTRRTGTSDSWGEPVNLGSKINTSERDAVACVSPDGHSLYFSSWGWTPRIGRFDIWQAPIIPIVDFNGDGIVDILDLSAMIEYWGTDNELYDIGPGPLGDGIVDVQDLLVLAEYLEPPVRTYFPIAHWALDETEGFTAKDSAGENDGVVVGIGVWQPAGGRVNGALEFTGDYFITAKSAVSPADGPFSVFAWIKGGAPGQSIVSQAGSANWLAADGASGALMTELSKSGRTGSGLSSQTIITDGAWHRIAFTWDGANRRLYVDGVLAAEDAQDSLAPSSGNVIIGAAKNMAPGTFWKGLIDDVRIYNRAVKP